MARSGARRKRQPDDDRALADDQRQAAGSVREHVIVVSPGNLSFDLDLWSNARIELRPHGRETGAGGRRNLRVVPGDSTNQARHGDDDGHPRAERTGTPAGQLPLPEALAPVAASAQVAEDRPLPDLGDIAADDVREADVESSLEAYPEPDDVFAENAEIAFESRAERAQPDTFITTAEGELRDQSDLAPDTALVEPIVEADAGMGEGTVGGATSTPVVPESELDPAHPLADEGESNQENARNPGAPFSEVTPEEFEEEQT